MDKVRCNKASRENCNKKPKERCKAATEDKEESHNKKYNRCIWKKNSQKQMQILEGIHNKQNKRRQR